MAERILTLNNINAIFYQSVSYFKILENASFNVHILMHVNDI